VRDESVVVVGAGPVGLAAAAELLEHGLEPLVLERGTHAGAAVVQFRHVRLFSPWSQLVAPAARRLLRSVGWHPPSADACPTGGDWVEQYLRPLAAALGDRVRCNAEVVGVAREASDRVLDEGRTARPFTVHVRARGGGEQRIPAQAVIDASGTWATPNPLGADGLPARGEATAAARISYRAPDLGHRAVHARYAGRHVAVAGSGHSACTALLALADLAEHERGTRISWVLRRAVLDDVTDGVADDRLPARTALERRAREAASAGSVRIVSGFRTVAVEPQGGGALSLLSVDGRRVDAVDEVIALTGFRPDLSWLSELRLELDPVLQAPVRLAPLIDPRLHSCRTVPRHGSTELAHPEPNVYLVGMKSFGRAPTFLALTGYEQVRSIAADLAGVGGRAAAELGEVTVPATDLCGGSELVADLAATPVSDCCGRRGLTSDPWSQSSTS
jgi:thioredoxin reductase